MELACVVTPVESYEDITNLLDNHNPHQDEDLISSTGESVIFISHAETFYTIIL